MVCRFLRRFALVYLVMTISQRSILLVEDHRDLAETVGMYLESQNYIVDYASDGLSAVQIAADEDFDAIVLDLNLPGIDGIEVCRRLRKELYKATPVIMLTARDQLEDKLQGFDVGADDYLVKPFSIEELLARLRALARRGSTAPERLQVEDLVLNTASHEVSRGGTAIHLSLKEFSLLRELMREPGRVQSREQLLQSVWGEGFVGDSNVLDVYVRYLRRKLEPEGQPTLIQTVRGVGFLLKPGTPKATAP